MKNNLLIVFMAVSLLAIICIEELRINNLKKDVKFFNCKVYAIADKIVKRERVNINREQEHVKKLNGIIETYPELSGKDGLKLVWEEINRLSESVKTRNEILDEIEKEIETSGCFENP